MSAATAAPTQIMKTGLTSEADVELLNASKPNFAGLALSERLPQCVDVTTAAAIRRTLDPRIFTVGAFKNESIDYVGNYADSGVLNVIQLCGSESNGYINMIKGIQPFPVMKRFKLKGASTIEEANECIADMVLIEADGVCDGSFDWALLAGLNRPYFLAGDFGEADVADVVAAATQAGAQPYAVSVSLV